MLISQLHILGVNPESNPAQDRRWLLGWMVGAGPPSSINLVLVKETHTTNFDVKGEVALHCPHYILVHSRQVVNEVYKLTHLVHCNVSWPWWYEGGRHVLYRLHLAHYSRGALNCMDKLKTRWAFNCEKTHLI